MTAGVVLVTGSAGFIGKAAAARLAEVGFEVRAGVRTSRSGSTPHRVTETPCDLADPEQIRRAVSGATLVVHAAYGAHGAMEGECARLLEAMAREGVESLIHLSSIAVYGERTGLIVESDAPAGDPGGYGAAKIACEALIRDWAEAAPGRRAVMLRPGVVYGRDGALWVGKMIERMKAGALGDLGAAASGPAPLVHVDDVAEAILLAAWALSETGSPIEGAIALNLVGPEPPSWRTYFAALAAAAGLPPLRPAGGLERAASRALALPAKVGARLGLPVLRRFALAPASGELALFRRDARFSIEAAERLLGFRPSIGLAEGLQRSIGPRQAKS